MRKSNIAGVDLNLLVALDALLRERSVSRAARVVGLSQPAMSRALGRLRDLFDDPLLVRAGHGMVATPQALALSEPLAAALQAIRRTLAPSGEFTPATTRRSFRIGGTDTTQAVVLPPLLERFGRVAPGVAVSTMPLRSPRETFERLAHAEWDLAIGSFADAPDGIRTAPLFRDRIVCLVRVDHPRVRDTLGLDEYLAESHLSIEPATPDDQPFTIEALLRERDLERRVVSRLENVAMAPFVVARTDLVCTAPRRTIAPFAEGLGLRVLEPPFEAPPFDLALAWHASVEADPANVWLRGSIASLFEDAPGA